MKAIRWILCLPLVTLCCASLSGLSADVPATYKGTPFSDTRYTSGAQEIPGIVQCAYYDFGGLGVAYNYSQKKNLGSGGLNPADGTYLNEFRINEPVSTSYTKFHNPAPNQIDDNPYDKVMPPENQLYLGWTEPGEWVNYTVNVKRAGVYSIDLLYTSHLGGDISFDLNGKKLTNPIHVPTTYDTHDPIAWRQWHHWNFFLDMADVNLPQGESVLTFHILTKGNFNLAYLDFEPK
jgi:hypothetical protein